MARPQLTHPGERRGLQRVGGEQELAGVGHMGEDDEATRLTAGREGAATTPTAAGSRQATR